MAKTKFAPFNAADYLDNDEVIAEYLAAALEDPDPEVFMMAVSNAAKARGIAKIASDSGLGRESLYKALAPGAKPRFETVRKVVDALGVRWTVVRPTRSRRRAHAHL
jgi:probable addiction module antidote protein